MIFDERKKIEKIEKLGLQPWTLEGSPPFNLASYQTVDIDTEGASIATLCAGIISSR
jgi:hypothetical protein